MYVILYFNEELCRGLYKKKGSVIETIYVADIQTYSSCKYTFLYLKLSKVDVYIFDNIKLFFF